jgi:hypothetical protein
MTKTGGFVPETASQGTIPPAFGAEMLAGGTVESAQAVAAAFKATERVWLARQQQHFVQPVREMGWKFHG